MGQRMQSPIDPSRYIFQNDDQNDDHGQTETDLPKQNPYAWIFTSNACALGLNQQQFWRIFTARPPALPASGNRIPVH
jgi:hypothetical protein